MLLVDDNSDCYCHYSQYSRFECHRDVCVKRRVVLLKIHGWVEVWQSNTQNYIYIIYDNWSRKYIDVVRSSRTHINIFITVIIVPRQCEQLPFTGYWVSVSYHQYLNVNRDAASQCEVLSNVCLRMFVFESELFSNQQCIFKILKVSGVDCQLGIAILFHISQTTYVTIFPKTTHFFESSAITFNIYRMHIDNRHQKQPNHACKINYQQLSNWWIDAKTNLAKMMGASTSRLHSIMTSRSWKQARTTPYPQVEKRETKKDWNFFLPLKNDSCTIIHIYFISLKEFWW